MDNVQPAASPHVAIVTFLEAKNHGAYLQAYALQRFLGCLGFSSDLLDYSNPHMAWVYSPIHRNGFEGDNLLEVLAKMRLALLDRRRNASFAQFAKRNLRLSAERYYTLDGLQDANGLYDVFLAGSDQVFSIRCSNLDSAYFLTFVDDDAKKATYAASFGFDAVPPQYRALYRSLLSPFSRLSVREESGARIVRDLLGADAPPVDIHADPTLLLRAADWDAVAAQSKRRAPRKYLLLYNVYPPKRLFAEAFRVARERGLSVVYLGRDLPIRDRLRRGVKAIGTAAPEDFVRYVRDATCVFTNSFHGAVFSVLYRKPFVVELDNEKAFNHRAEALLDKLSLDGRALSGDAGTVLGAPIPWDGVERVLEAERTRSADYLRGILSPRKNP